MTVTELVVKINADLSGFKKGVGDVSSKMADVGEKMKSVGTNMTLFLTGPILALGTASVLAFGRQAKALANVESAIKSTGGAAGFTIDELAKKASKLQNASLFGDEDILQNVTANLLTFTNISGEAFERTQLAALNLSARIGTDLTSATIQLGKALNDPVANMGALSRSGIQFSDAQKAVINKMAETNRLADAQTLILDELDKQFGGAAEAAARAGLGPFTQLKNTIGDVTESFGKIIAEAILPFVDKIKVVVLWVDGLTESQKKAIIVFLAVAAAMGPIVLILGTLLAMVPAIVTGIGLISVALATMSVSGGVIFATIAAVVALGVGILALWAKMSKLKEDPLKLVIDTHGAESDAFAAQVEIQKSLELIRDAAKKNLGPGGAGGSVSKLVDGLKKMKVMLNLLQQQAVAAKPQFDEATETLKKLFASVPQSLPDLDMKVAKPDPVAVSGWTTFYRGATEFFSTLGDATFDINNNLIKIGAALSVLKLDSSFTDKVLSLASDINTVVLGFEALVKLLDIAFWKNVVDTFIKLGTAIGNLFTGGSSSAPGGTGTPGVKGPFGGGDTSSPDFGANPTGAGGQVIRQGNPIGEGIAATIIAAVGIPTLIKWFTPSRKPSSEEIQAIMDGITASGGRGFVGTGLQGIDLTGLTGIDLAGLQGFMGGGQANAGTSQNITTNLDGRTIARVIMPYIVEELSINGTTV